MAYEQYLSAGMHIGMKQQTKDMKKFIYKVREDGLAVFDLQIIEKRIKLAGQFLSKFERVMIVSRKAVGWKPATKFAEIVNGKTVNGRFLPGTITNSSFEGYYEPQVLLAIDPFIDIQAIKEAVKMRVPVVALCDTSNETGMIDLIVPVNNKGRKSIAMVCYLLAKEILKSRGTIKTDEEFKQKLEDFESSEEASQPMPQDKQFL